MSKDDLIRARTDVLIALLRGEEIDLDGYRAEIEKSDSIDKQDQALMSAISGAEQMPYSMRDLRQPMTAASMVIPQDYSSYLNGHMKVTMDYVRDWPQAAGDNQHGEHHPFSMKSSCCPLLHGGAHGEPEYAYHIMRTIDNDAEILRKTAEQEKRKDVVPSHLSDYLGRPIESQHDLYVRDRSRNSFTDDEPYLAAKQDELMSEFGLLPYLFGLEWNTGEQRDNFMSLLSDMAATEGPESTDAKRFANQFQEQAGISWGRALRNWRERFTPMSHWWERPADRHGPTEPHPGDADSLSHFHSPWVQSEEGITPSMTYHWWEPFQYWGGVGRGRESLDGIMSQSYPDVFNGGWMNEQLISLSMENSLSPNGPHGHGGGHFPATANDPMMQDHPMRGAVSTGFVSPGDTYEKRRANWSSASNHAYLHPSEIEGMGGRMIIPSDALLTSPLGDALTGQADLGGPRIGRYAEEHPSSTNEYWIHHNPHFAASDQHIGRVMQQMAERVQQQFGSQALMPADITDPQQSTIARGNLQQVAAAANHALMRLPMGASYRSPAPVLGEGGQLVPKTGPIGPVSPDSHAVVPPVYVSGDTDSWGHEMPATLSWRFDPKQGGVSFDMKDEPFTLMQRTAHENHVKAISPSLVSSILEPKKQDVNAMLGGGAFGNFPKGWEPLRTGMIHKADDYEPNGVFNTLTKPAHTVYDLDDILTIKGFSGEWVVQKMPKGKRMIVKKEGKMVEPMELPSDVKKSLKERDLDFTVDAYLHKGVLHVVDLLVHKGNNFHFEPLEDRLNALRTLYHSDDFVHFPMPKSCVTTDDDGLKRAAEDMGGTDLLIRDATSSFIKDKEAHPKWILYADTEIAKQLPYPPLPEISVRAGDVILSYPGITTPVIVSGDFDGVGMDIEKYDGTPTLITHARTQERLWGPVAITLLKEGDGGGMVSSTTEGTHSPVHSAPMKRTRPRRRKSTGDNLLLRAPEMLDDSGDREQTSELMRATRRTLTEADEAKTSDELCSEVKGLTPKLLEVFGPEYGIERTEDGDKWTVNEAIDNDMVDKNLPRMNRASPDGGAWSGMQADLTAPRGPTELVDDDATTFGAEGKEKDDNQPELPLVMHLEVRSDDGLETEAVLDVKGERAVIRYPKRTREEQEEEEEIKTDSVPEEEDEEPITVES